MARTRTTILLAEDDQLLREMYTLKLQNEGYAVVAAEDGEVCMTALAKQKPALVLLDVIMPKRDGFSVLEAMKKDATLKNIPVILLTNLGQEHDIERGKKLGANDYLVKANLTPGQVVDKVKAILK